MQEDAAIFIPCYNASETILETLQSVKASIDHAGVDIPVHIFDDCSRDNTADIVKDFILSHKGFVFHEQEKNRGERELTNTAVSTLSRDHKWLLLIHADDLAEQSWVKELLQQIGDGKYKDLFTVWSSYSVFLHYSGKIVLNGDLSGVYQYQQRSRGDIRQMLEDVSSPWRISGSALNLHAFGELGGFDTKMPQYGDTDYYIRGLLKGYKDLYIGKPLTKCRVIDGSVTDVSFKSNRDVREIMMLRSKFGEEFGRASSDKLLRKAKGILTRRILKGAFFGKLPVMISSFRDLVQLIRAK